MSAYGSPMFAAYAQNLRKVYWAEFIDAQTRATRTEEFRASLVQPPIPEKEDYAHAYDWHRHRGQAKE